MEQSAWTSTAIQKLFRMSLKSKQTLFNAEKRGTIPASTRTPRGRTQVRRWSIDQIPLIGEQFGFLKKPKKQNVICFYTAKGGVLKTTLTHSFARMLALNGIKTIIIGLDIQCSITDIVIPPSRTESLDASAPKPLGLFHLLYDKAPLNDVIKKTEIPTLDIIPETPDLNALEKKLRDAKRREYVFKDKVIKKLNEYDVIIFDNGPSWNMLIENALTASTSILSPIGCDIGTYQSLQTNLDTIYEFKDAMNLTWENLILIPTLLEQTKLSQQIYGTYLNQYGDNIIATPIRRGIKGQEAILLGKSAIEHEPTSPLSLDYFELIEQVWKKINKENTNKRIKVKEKSYGA